MRRFVSDSSRLDPGKAFPEDLTSIDRDDLDILNSRNHRARDVQYIRDGEVDAETDGQHHELREELDRRQAIRDAPAHDVNSTSSTSRTADVTDQAEGTDEDKAEDEPQTEAEDEVEFRKA
jgi:hypothetical protein